ncbi:MAG TPA: porin [Kofleriaceae bacterium]|nr:porin [Kofleriaceae bacterium]
MLAAPALGHAQPTPDGLPPDSAPVTAEAPVAEPPPEPPAPAAGRAASVTYDGGFALETADHAFELKLGLRSQFRFDLVRPDVDMAELQARFAVNRLRLQLDGHAYGEANTFKLEFDMANRGFAILKDAFVDHAFSPGLHLRAGQWKKPFNRQEMVSDFSSELVERSLENDFSGAGRDQGVALHNDYEKSPEGVEWALGVFNAGTDKPTQKTTCVPGATPADPQICTTGLPSNVPTDWGPAIVAHVGWNHGHIKGYSEGDLEGGPLRLAVAVSYRLNPRDLDKDANGDLQLQHTVALDGMLKAWGFSLTGGLVLVKDGQADLATGFYGQASYMLTPKTVLAAARFAQVPDGDEKKREILGGLDWLFQGHKLKLMVDAGVVQTTGVDTNDFQLRSQLQLVL